MHKFSVKNANLQAAKPKRRLLYVLTPIFVVTLFVFGIYISPLVQFWYSHAAATIIWDGSSDGDGDGLLWSNPLNWNTNVVPAVTDDVLIDLSTTVRITEPVTINSLVIGNAASTAISVLEFGYDATSIGPLTLTNGSLTLYNAASITHLPASGSFIAGRINIDVQNGNANIYGTINVNSKGYTAGLGQGTNHEYGAGGGGYGGEGGIGAAANGLIYYLGGAGGVSYGSYLAPTDLGSGGGLKNLLYAPGGGAVKLTVSGTTTINGTITSDGAVGPAYGGSSGGGSGGSIFITTGTLAGNGVLRANGGTTSNWDGDYRYGGGGGGGRIALFYTTDSSTLTTLNAKGGKPPGIKAQIGGGGTIYKKLASATNGDLIIDNVEATWTSDINAIAKTPLVDSLAIDNLTINRFARVDYSSTLNVGSTLNITNSSHLNAIGTINSNTLNINSSAWLHSLTGSTVTYSSLNWTGGIVQDNGGTMALISSGSDITIPVGSTLIGNTPRSFTNMTVNGTLTHDTNGITEVNKINYTISGNFTLASGAIIDIDNKGYTGSEGPGQGQDHSAGAGGGGYGGEGGIGQNYGYYLGGVGGVSYGSYSAPVDLGSGGGLKDLLYAPGGGAVQLTVDGTTTINGTISSNGAYGRAYGGSSGGGSGGSIYIITNVLAGNGVLRANGGATQDWEYSRYYGGGGSGGRIALYYTIDSSAFVTLSAKGGKPPGVKAQLGGGGTIYKKQSTAINGNLVIDNEETSWSTDFNSIAKTPLPNLFIIDNLTVNRFARLDYSSTLNVVSTLNITNSAHLNAIGTINTNILNLNSSASLHSLVGSTVTYSSLNWTGGIVHDNGGTMALISGGGDSVVPLGSTLIGNTPRTFTNLTINGTLTHDANGTSPDYKVNYTISNNFIVPAGGQINLDYKGYAGGEGPGAGVDGDNGAGGGGYGGDGGRGQVRLGGVAYGDQYAPDWLGSGGGIRSGGYINPGGGAIKLTVGNTATINGTISANGAYGDGYERISGGGSGGSIWIVTNILEGNGIVRANGGNTRDWDYDGGGGGGGRIAFYYSIDNSAFTTLTVNGGTTGAGALPGGVGTIFFGGLSADPINLKQYKQDGSTGIGPGGSTNENSVILTFQIQDANVSDTLTPQVEFVPIGNAFNNIATDSGTPVVYSGSIVTGTVPVGGLADGSSYHWQARSCDATTLCSNWVSFGNNTEAEADIRVVMNANPNTPTIPPSSFYINGQYTNNLQPMFDFVLSDPNTIDGIGYEIQIASDSEFLNMITRYVSPLGAQGAQSFTVGQAQGTGNYVVGAEAQEITTGSYYWRVKAIDDKGGESDWTVAPGTPSFIVDLSRPTNATNVRMKAHVGAINEYYESAEVIWFNRNDLFFKWDAGTDAEGVKGYCLYLGDDVDGDPASQKGLLGTSILSTTGTDCQFITDQAEIDFANSAYRGATWLTSSDAKYYFKVKTIDIANNTFVGPDVTNFISFNFDITPPQNVTAISAASGTFSNTADMFFTWPTSTEHAGSDENSGLLGFQYAINDRNTWFGNSIDPATGLSFSSLQTQQPFYFSQEVQDLIQLGQNIIYFRVLDVAGNYSELRTAYINYGGEAPKFAPGEEVTVTPSTNTVNQFAFSWNPAIPSSGNTIASYYYMINTVPPVSYSTITSNSATYIPTNATSIAAGKVAGLRKGSNTIYVIAIDNLGNYSPTNYIMATFNLNSTLPDPPKNLTVADSSIKDVSIWRAALVWDLPDYLGTGDLTYHIERSEDGTTWNSVGDTTGLAYIDTVPESKRYYWRVSTTDTSDESLAEPSYSAAVTVIPKGAYTSPAKLTSGPITSSITTTTAQISWTTARTSDSKVAFGLAMGNYFESEISVSTQLTDHKIKLTNLLPGTTYYYVAKWTDEDGNTGISDEMTFTTQPPPVVKDVVLSNLGITSVMVNFTTINSSRARIYYGPTTSFGGIKEIATSKEETTYTLELSQLSDATKYYYKINTFDEEDREYEGTILDFTTLPRPRVYNVNVQQVINTARSTLYVSWLSNTKISSIVTFYPESNPEVAKDVVDIKLTEGEHKMLLKELLPSTTYIIRVSGRDIIGNEATSDLIRITTAADSRAPILSGMSIEGSNITQISGLDQNTTSQLIISWTTDEPSTSQVEYGEGTGSDYNQLTQEDKDLSYSHVVIISGLTPSKVYHLRAISRDAAGNISRSIDTLTITPKSSDNAFDLVITILKESFGFLNQ